MRKRVETTIAAAVLAICLSLTTGCGASFFSAKTEASYSVSPDGSRVISYSSDKEQQGLEASWEDTPDGKVKLVKIKVDKTGTAESAIAAALQLQLELAKLLEQVIPLAAAAAKTAAVK